MVLPLLALQLLRLPGFGLPLYSPAASWYRTGLGLPCLAPTFRSVSACYHLISSLERFRWDFVTFVTFPADSTDCDRARSGNARDRKSTRLNSSHLGISYAVFCLKNLVQPPFTKLGITLNYTQPIDALTLSMQFALIGGAILTAPFILYQVGLLISFFFLKKGTPPDFPLLPPTAPLPI